MKSVSHAIVLRAEKAEGMKAFTLQYHFISFHFYWAATQSDQNKESESRKRDPEHLKVRVYVEKSMGPDPRRPRAPVQPDRQ